LNYLVDRTAGFAVMVNGWLSFWKNRSAKTRSRLGVGVATAECR
jgi:hypothetical protein